MELAFTSNTYSQLMLDTNAVWSRAEDLPDGYEYGFEVAECVHLHISNLELAMMPGAGITVNKGAYLHISDSKLCCIDPLRQWQGILVKGDADKKQTFEPINGFREQGILVLRGSSKAANMKMEINDAERGVELESGALLQAYRCHFINCPKGVVIRPYSQPLNLCSIDHCNFVWKNSPALKLHNFDARDYVNEFRHIELGYSHEGKSGVNGVTIHACKFVNELKPEMQLVNNGQLGKGVYAFNSCYFILKDRFARRSTTKYPSKAKTNSFHHLYHGICCYGSATQGDLDISINDFFNCKLDVSFSNMFSYK